MNFEILQLTFVDDDGPRLTEPFDSNGLCYISWCISRTLFSLSLSYRLWYSSFIIDFNRSNETYCILLHTGLDGQYFKASSWDQSTFGIKNAKWKLWILRTFCVLVKIAETHGKIKACTICDRLYLILRMQSYWSQPQRVEDILKYIFLRNRAVSATLKSIADV